MVPLLQNQPSSTAEVLGLRVIFFTKDVPINGGTWFIHKGSINVQLFNA